MLASAIKCETYSEMYNTYCTEDILKTFNITDEERATLRSSSVYLAVDADAVSEVIKVGTPTMSLKQVGAITILSGLLILASIISFIVFLCFCCCCDRVGSPSSKKVKVCSIISAVFIVGYVGVVVAAGIFMGKVNSDNKKLFCFTARMAKHVLDGLTDQDFKFIGFSGLKNVLLSFVGEFDKVSTLSADFDAISNKKLPEKSQKALASLPVFYNKYKDSTTSDGQGNKSKPLTIQNLTSKINDAINQEFLLYDTIAQQITQAAAVGKSYASNSLVSNVTQSLNDVVTQVDSLTVDIESGFTTASTIIDSYKTVFTSVFISVLALGAILFVFSVLTTLAIVINIKKSQDRCRCCSKVILGFMSFIVILMSLLASSTISATITMGSVCSVIGGFLDVSNASDYLSKFNISVNGTTGALFDQCLPAGATGDITKLFINGTDVLNQTKTFLNGLSTYDQIKNNITQAPNTSVSISYTVNIWKQFMVSVFPDQQKAVEALVGFNSLVNCDNSLIYQLNAKNCTAQSNCKGIYDSSSFTPPSCSSSPSQATSLYTSLKAFTVDEEKLLGAMITDLSGTAETTPLSLNNAVRTDLLSIVSSLDNIKSKLTQTMVQASTFTDGFAKSVNCTIIRREINDFEVALCFNMNKDFYFFSAFLSIAVFIILLYSWMFCCMLRYSPKFSLDSVYANELQDNAPMYRSKADSANNAAVNYDYNPTDNNYPNISGMNDTEYPDNNYTQYPNNNYTVNNEHQPFINESPQTEY